VEVEEAAPHIALHQRLPPLEEQRQLLKLLELQELGKQCMLEQVVELHIEWPSAQLHSYK
jgi:hypothetical protein